MKQDPIEADIYKDETFTGAFVVYGAAIGVRGTDQANAYHRMTGELHQLAPSSLTFKFGNYLCQIEGIIKVLL